MQAVHELLDDGFAPPECDLLVVGCGNILRGDDAVGPLLIRELWQSDLPQGVRLVDGGTAGMDVAFQMRGAARVVIVDAASTGHAPGTMFRVPAEQFADLPPASGVHTHSFRWDHAIAFSRWMLGPLAPTDITVFLIEAGGLDPGAELSEPVRASMLKVAALIRAEFFPVVDDAATVEITADGYLRLSAELAEQYFPADVVASIFDGRSLCLVPIRSAANGGHLLKQRNAAGDRTVLVRELCDADPAPGRYRVRWDHARGALAVDILEGVEGGGHG